MIRFYAIVALLFTLSDNTEASLLVSNDEGFGRIGSLAKNSFRLESRIQIRLDGSDASSLIQRRSDLKDDLVFLDRSAWRLHKQNPFDGISHEWLHQDSRLFLISSQNEKVASPESHSENIWIESLIAPLTLAAHWGLVEPDFSLSDLLQKLKEGPLSAGENQMMLVPSETSGSEDYLIKITGSLLHDKKTKAVIEGTWHLKFIKVVPQDLKEHLMRSS